MILRRVIHRIKATGTAHSRVSQFRAIMSQKSFAGDERPYILTPLPVFGMEVHGIDLKRSVSDELVEIIKEDVTK